MSALPLCTDPEEARCVLVLREDPGLAEGITAREVPAAVRASTADVRWLARGGWRPHVDRGGDRGHLGLLVLDGLLLRRVRVHGAPCAELLGPGDLLRPWSTEVEALSSIPVRASFWVLADARMAVLDRGFAERVARWPEVIDSLVERITDRTRRLTYSLATQRSKRVDQRLWLALWQIADRWGTVRAHGVEIQLPGLSHRVLGSLIAARRPSVTTAIGGLVERGLLERLDDGGLLLCGEPSAEVVRTAAVDEPRTSRAEANVSARTSAARPVLVDDRRGDEPEGNRPSQIDDRAGVAVVAEGAEEHVIEREHGEGDREDEEETIAMVAPETQEEERDGSGRQRTRAGQELKGHPRPPC